MNEAKNHPPYADGEEMTEAPACSSCGSTAASVANDAVALDVPDPICCEVAL